MTIPIVNLFTNKDFHKKVQSKLPHLFQIAEIDSSRAGKIGMEVGNLRERIIVSMLLSELNKGEVTTDIPTTEPEVDVVVKDNMISIKTITGNRLPGVKLIWTVDAEKAQQFRNSYFPSCDILLVQIKWKKNHGGMFFIPISVQKQILKEIGRNNYIKLPKQGTNPRGVEMSKFALEHLVGHPTTLKIPIFWQKEDIHYNPYSKWISLWEENQ